MATASKLVLDAGAQLVKHIRAAHPLSLFQSDCGECAALAAALEKACNLPKLPSDAVRLNSLSAGGYEG